jgi:hypothetical protein
VGINPIEFGSFNISLVISDEGWDLILIDNFSGSAFLIKSAKIF